LREVVTSGHHRSPREDHCHLYQALTEIIHVLDAEFVRQRGYHCRQILLVAPAFTITVLVGALWTHTHPSPAMAAVYRNEPSLAIAQGFAQSLEHVLATYLAGLLAWEKPRTGECSGTSVGDA
jgi:hypothetical protein